MEKEELLKSLSDAGLEKLLPDIQKLIKESVRIQLEPLQGATLPVGSSHFGGMPDLPFGFSWPLYKGTPMSFIGQIRLEDVAHLEPSGELPDSGLLSFFYDANQDTYGGSPDDRGGWAVHYVSGLAILSLHTATAPGKLPPSAIFTECKLNFSRELTLPGSAAQHLDNLTWNDSDVQAYENFLASFPSEDDHASRHHRMFGHPNQIQDDMQLQSVLFANGVPSMDDPRAAALARQKEEWQLLLQIDSDDVPGMSWSSSGMLYYWIHNAALHQHKFDETWLVLQAE